MNPVLVRQVMKVLAGLFGSAAITGEVAHGLSGNVDYVGLGLTVLLAVATYLQGKQSDAPGSIALHELTQLQRESIAPPPIPRHPPYDPSDHGAR